MNNVTRSIVLGAVFIFGALSAMPEFGLADNQPARLERIDSELRTRVSKAQVRALQFLESTQQPDGGWAGFQGSDPAITALVVKCFAQHPEYGAKHPVVRRALEFLMMHVQPDGGIYVPQMGLYNYYTSVVVMALSKSDDPKIKKVVADAQAYLTKLQWDEAEGHERDDVFYGGAGYGKHKRPDLSNTQLMLEALYQSGLSPEHPVYKRAELFVSRCQMLAETNDQEFARGGDGGFIYSPANGGESKAGVGKANGKKVLRSYGSMTYAGFKSLLYAKVKRDDIRIRRAMQWISSHYTLSRNPNMPEAQSKEGLYYYFHTFARALDAWGQEVIVDSAGTRHEWRSDLCKELLRLQRKDGRWVNEADRWFESNPHLVTAYAVLALQTAIN